MKIRRFLNGLKSGISAKLVHFMLTQYAEVVRRALAIEQYTANFMSYLSSQEGRKQPQPYGGSKGNDIRRKFQKTQLQGQGVKGSRLLIAGFAGSSTQRSLVERTTKHVFGSPGHMKKDCPKLATVPTQRPLIKGRAYALNTQEAEDPQEDVLTSEHQQTPQQESLDKPLDHPYCLS